jgi:predicted TIM-barrel fold metal-dependent hydrolase
MVVGGAVISGSFQGYDQTYLLDALHRLGPGFVGVTQLPVTVTDEEVLALSRAGIRAVRVNVRRGGSQMLTHLDTLARRVHELAGWHTEIYIDAVDLADLAPLIGALPRVSIDHLGLSQAGLPDLLRLAEQGVYVKATGFGRGDLDVPAALGALAHAHPTGLMAGTDLPCTRAPRPFKDADLDLLRETLGDDLTAAVLHDNAQALYRSAPPPAGAVPGTGPAANHLAK